MSGINRIKNLSQNLDIPERQILILRLYAARLQGESMKFWRNIQGNVGLLFGICSVPVIGALGIAIDIARLNMVQTRMQADADAAALSARAENGSVRPNTASPQSRMCP